MWDHWVRLQHGLGGRERYAGHTVGGFLSVLGKVNVSWTGVPQDLDLFQDQAWRPFAVRDPTILTIGLGDLHGFEYWGKRLFVNRPIPNYPKKIGHWFCQLME
jgi:hypothetical protein